MVVFLLVFSNTYDFLIQTLPFKPAIVCYQSHAWSIAVLELSAVKIEVMYSTCVATLHKGFVTRNILFGKEEDLIATKFDKKKTIVTI